MPKQRSCWWIPLRNAQKGRIGARRRGSAVTGAYTCCCATVERRRRFRRHRVRNERSFERSAPRDETKSCRRLNGAAGRSACLRGQGVLEWMDGGWFLLEDRSTFDAICCCWRHGGPFDLHFPAITNSGVTPGAIKEKILPFLKIPHSGLSGLTMIMLFARFPFEEEFCSDARDVNH